MVAVYGQQFIEVGKYFIHNTFRQRVNKKLKRLFGYSRRKILAEKIKGSRKNCPLL